METRVAQQLNRLIPGFEENVITKPPSTVLFQLPTAPNADYRFLLYFEPEMQIHAELLGTGHKRYFWYMPFEEAAYRNDLEKLFTAFADTVEALIFHPTRIVQRRGLLSHSFKLECQRDGQWQRIYGHSCSRFGFDVPPIRGRRHVYNSSAVKPSDVR